MKIINFNKNTSINYLSMIVILTTSVIFNSVIYGQSSEFIWAKQAGDIGWDAGYSIATDMLDNIIVTGVFQGSVTFGTEVLINTYGWGIFIVKYDKMGDVLWAKSAGGTENTLCLGFSITTDVLGNSIIAGIFSGTVTFGNTILTSANEEKIFIAKYDEMGNVLWAKKADGIIPEFGGPSIATDEFNNVIITGNFEGSATFGTIPLTSLGGSDVFIAKYDASGNALWAVSAGGTSDENGISIATDELNNVIATGNFEGSATFGTIPLTSVGGSDVFIAKYDASGNVLWAVSAGGTNDEGALSIAIDGSGIITVAGVEYTSMGSNIFSAKYDEMGNLLWTKNVGGNGSVLAHSIATDMSGNSFMTGYFIGTFNFGTTTLTSVGIIDIFITKLSNPIITDIGFRPNLDGFKFKNTKTMRIWDMFKQFFGKDEVEYENGIKRLSAYLYFLREYENITNGSCFGFASLPLINKFNRDQTIAGEEFKMPQKDPLFNEQNWNEVEKSIAFYHGVQMSKLFDSDIFHHFNPNSALETICNYMKNDIPIVVGWQLAGPEGTVPGSGHVVTPYKIIEYTNFSYVYIYNNEYPGETHRLTFDKINNQWEYDNSNPRIYGDNDPKTTDWALEVFPITLYEQKGIRPWSDPDLKHIAWLPIEGMSIVVENSVGKVVGYVNNKFTNTIGAYIKNKFKQSYDERKLSSLSVTSNDDYIINITSTETDTGEINIWSNGHTVQLRDIELNSDTEDQLQIFQNKIGMSYQTNTNQKEFSATLIRELDDASRCIDIDKSTIDIGETQLFEIVDDQTLKYYNPGNPKIFKITFKQRGIEGGTLVYRNVNIGNNETRTFTPQIWKSLNTTEVFVEVDQGSDGTIDDTYTLPSPASNINSQIMLVFQNVIWDYENKIFCYDIALNNIGSETLFPQVTAVISSIYPEPPTITLNNTNGGGNGVGGYWDYSSSIGQDGQLSPGETSETKRWEFYNPNMLNFYFSCDVYAVLPSSLPKAGATVEKQTLTFYADVNNQKIERVENIKNEPELQLPTEFALEQNYPNPFNAETMIKYQLPQDAKVQLSIFNLLGQEIRTLVYEQKNAGYHTTNWDGKDNSGKDVVSGVYIYRIKAGEFVEEKKMVVIR